MSNVTDILDFLKDWGIALLGGVLKKDDAFKTHPVNVLNEKTLRCTLSRDGKPPPNLPSGVEKYVTKVRGICRVIWPDWSRVFQ